LRYITNQNFFPVAQVVLKENKRVKNNIYTKATPKQEKKTTVRQCPILWNDQATTYDNWRGKKQTSPSTTKMKLTY